MPHYGRGSFVRNNDFAAKDPQAWNNCPMIEALRELGTYIEQKRNDCVISWSLEKDELNIAVAPANISRFIEFLRVDSR